MSSSFDISKFMTKINAKPDSRLTHIIKAAHFHKLSDDEITKAVKHILEKAESKPSDESNPESKPKSKPSGECLQKAACFGYLKLAKLLIEKGVNVNTRDRNRNTPLINACHTKHFEIARFLIESGAFVSARNHFSWSALKYTCLNNNKDFVKYLIEHDANTDIITIDDKKNIINKLVSKDANKYADMIEYLKKVRDTLGKKE